MRPVKLEINAFGSFSEKTVIDFSELGCNGLYLISGETGSGKTTIFDALMFALYGETTNNAGRDGRLMKSQYVEDNVECYVSLLFTEKGKDYFIRRAPKQLKGRGKTEKVATVELLCPDKNPITKISEADEEINSIIGLTSKQFSQIVMLAQGQFSKFLLSSTNEKSILFRTIFDTENYETLEKTLSEKQKEVFVEYEGVNNRQKALVESIEGLKGLESSEKLEMAKKSELLPENILEIINDVNKDAEERLNTLKGDIDKVEISIKGLESKLNKDIERERKELLLHDKKEALDELNQELVALEEDKTTFTSYGERVKVLSQEIDELEKDKPKLVELENKTKALQEHTLKLSRLKEKELHLKEDFQQLSRRRELLLAEEKNYVGAFELVQRRAKELNEKEKRFDSIKQLRDLFANISTISDEIDKLKIKEEDINKIVNAVQSNIKAWQESSNQLEDILNSSFLTLERESFDVERERNLISDISKSIDRKSEKELDVINLNGVISESQSKLIATEKLRYEIFMDTQAVSIAKLLEEDKPCPVCGSLHHPAPAISGDKYTAADYEKIENELECIQTYHSKLLEKALKANEEIRLLSDVIEKDLKSLGYESIEIARNSIVAKEESVKDKIAKKNVLEKKLLDLNNTVKMQTKKLEELLYEKHSVEKFLASKSSIIEDMEKRASELSSALLISKDDIDDEFNSAFKEYKEANSNLEIANDLYTKSQRLLEEKSKNADLLNTKKEEQQSNYILLVTLEKEIEHIKCNIDELSTGLSYKNLEQIQEAINLTAQEKNKLEKAIEDYNNKILQIRNDYSELNGSIFTIEKELETFEKIDRESVCSSLDELKTRKQLLSDESSNVNVVYKNTINTLFYLKKLRGESGDLDKKYRMLKELSDVANGKLSGEDRLSIETYVQVYFLDRILKRANRVLLKMTNGQFEMERSSAAKKKSSQYGLDIDVLDHATGKKRSVTTLSGGEVFKASLSLALGMSEEIQCRAGSVKMETLYIDEGFGTLDESSLSSAVGILQTLAQDGKLIGVISHRPELKERIEKKIIVTKKEGRGSYLTFV